MRWVFIVCAILGSTLGLWAQAAHYLSDYRYSTYRTNDGHLILNTQTCDEAKKEVERLRKWTVRMGEAPGAFPNLDAIPEKCTVPNTVPYLWSAMYCGRCIVQLDSSVPRVVRNTTDDRELNKFLFEEHPSYLVTRNPNGELLLQSPNCPDGQKEVQGLRAWTQSMGERVGPLTKGVVKDGKCIISIDSSVPSIVRKYHGRQAPHNGPNCFNIPYMLKKFMPSFRVVGLEETEFWFQSPLCRELKTDEKIIPGDMAIFRSMRDNGAPEAGHAEALITENLRFMKQMPEKETIFQLYQTVPRPIDLVHEADEATFRSCGRTVGIPPANERCLTWQNFYRCKGFDQYLAEAPKPLVDRYRPIQEVLEKIENDFGCRLTGQAPLYTVDILSTLELSLNAIQTLTTQESAKFGKNPPQNSYEYVLWKSLLVRIAGLKEQIDITRRELSGRPMRDKLR